MKPQLAHGRTGADKTAVDEVEGAPYLIKHRKKSNRFQEAEPPLGKHGKGFPSKRHRRRNLPEFYLILYQGIKPVGYTVKNVEHEGRLKIPAIFR
jgi:hypothetical protein